MLSNSLQATEIIGYASLTVAYDSGDYMVDATSDHLFFCGVFNFSLVLTML